MLNATYLKFMIFFFISLVSPVFSFHSAKKNGFNQFNTLKKPSIKMSLGGLELGAGTLITGLILDNTISKNSLDILVSKNSKLLYEGYKKSIVKIICEKDKKKFKLLKKKYPNKIITSNENTLKQINPHDHPMDL